MIHPRPKKDGLFFFAYVADLLILSLYLAVDDIEPVKELNEWHLHEVSNRRGTVLGHTHDRQPQAPQVPDCSKKFCAWMTVAMKSGPERPRISS